MLVQLRDYSDEVTGPGFVPIPAKEAKRARTKLLPGSCLIIQPMPGNPGAHLSQVTCALPLTGTHTVSRGHTQQRYHMILQNLLLKPQRLALSSPDPFDTRLLSIIQP